MIPPDKLCFVKIFVEVGFQKTQLEGSERLLARAFTTSCSKPFSKTKSFGGVGGDAWVMLRPYLRTVLYYTVVSEHGYSWLLQFLGT